MSLLFLLVHQTNRMVDSKRDPGIETRRVENNLLSRPPPFAPTELGLGLGLGLVFSYLPIPFTQPQIYTLLLLLHLLPLKNIRLV